MKTEHFRFFVAGIFFVVCCPQLSSQTTNNNYSSYSDRYSELMKNCFTKKVQRCIVTCQDYYGYSYETCVNEMCILNEINLAEWKPECESEVLKTLIEECLNEKVDRCITSCQDYYGYSYETCVNEMCILNEINLAEWKPECENEILNGTSK